MQAPKAVIESMLGRLDEWATAKKNRIEAESKHPCSGKCSYNGCSTTALEPIEKHVSSPLLSMNVLLVT